MKLCLRHACASISSKADAKEAVPAPLLMTLLSSRPTILPGVMLNRYSSSVLWLLHRLAVARHAGM